MNALNPKLHCTPIRPLEKVWCWTGETHRNITYIIVLQLPPSRPHSGSRVLYDIHSLNLFTSSLLLATTSATSSPQMSSGCTLCLASQQSRICFSAEPNSKTTQFSRLNGRLGSQRTRVGRDGTSCGGIIDRPRWISSKMNATSSSSIGRRLELFREGWGKGERTPLLDLVSSNFTFAMQQVAVQSLVKLLSVFDGQGVWDRFPW